MIELLYHNQKGDKQIVVDKEWKRQLKIQDIRDTILKKIVGLNYTDVGIMVYFLKLGTYFCVFRQIKTDRPLDNHAIWVFLPKDEGVNPLDLKRLLAQVIEKVKSEPPYEESSIKAFSSNVEKLGINIEVEACQRPVFLSADNKKIACRYYCDEEDSLFDVLRDLYQPEYEKYEALLFLDKHSALRGGADVDDLTGHGLVGQETVEPSELRCQLPSDIEVFYCGQPMKEPVFIPKNESVAIELRRKGYVPILIFYSKGDPITDLEWKVRVSRDLFEIKNKQNEISDYSLKINGAPVGDYVDMTVSEAKKASFQIEKSGYEPCPYKKENVDFCAFLSSNRKIIVELRKDDQKFDIRQSHYESVKVVVATSKVIGKDDSPLEGYIREDNVLEYDRHAFLNSWLFWVMMAMALVVGGIAGFYIHHWTHPHEIKVSEQTPDPGKPRQETPSENEPPNVVEKSEGEGIVPIQEDPATYLDEKTVWNRYEMEKIAALQGFWDLLNRYDIDGIRSEVWSGKLSGSSNYNRIVSAFGNKKSSDFAEKTYTDATKDCEITVERYIQTVENYQVSSEEASRGQNQNGGVAPAEPINKDTIIENEDGENYY